MSLTRNSRHSRSRRPAPYNSITVSFIVPVSCFRTAVTSSRVSMTGRRSGVRAQRLVLRRRAHMLPHRQPGQKRGNLRGAHCRRMRLSVEHDGAPDPINVRLLGPAAVMANADRLAHPIHQSGRTAFLNGHAVQLAKAVPADILRQAHRTRAQYAVSAMVPAGSFDIFCIAVPKGAGVPDSPAEAHCAKAGSRTLRTNRIDIP